MTLADQIQKRGVPLFSNSGHLDSLRHLGLTTEDAVNELVDNSFDADANTVHIQVLDEKDGMSILVEDDGKGIPSDKVERCLSFGGRAVAEPRGKTGRFGWGLSSAITCQARRGELYSTTGNGWTSSYIDLDELKQDPYPSIPEAATRPPPEHLSLKLHGSGGDSATGTVVYMRRCDRLPAKKVDTIVKDLLPRLGEVYRKFLTGGKTIFVNENKVEVVDPLMLTPGCKYSDEIGLSKAFASIPPIIIPEEKNPETNDAAQIEIKVVVLDGEGIRKHTDSRSISRRVGLNIKNQGFYLMRNKRQIGRAQDLGVFVKHNDLNYFRAEVSFPPALDEWFGVQTNKTRFHLDERIRSLLEEQLKNVLEQVRAISKSWQAKQDAGKTGDGIRKSELIAAQAIKLLKKSRTPPTKEETQQVHQKLTEEKEREVKKIERDPHLTPDEKKEKLKAVENKFQFKRPYVLSLEAIENGHFYFPRPGGDASMVVINTAHPFYTKVYEKSTQNGMDTYLDLVLFTLAHAELNTYGSPEIKKFYQQQRAEWTAILNAFLDDVYEEERSA